MKKFLLVFIILYLFGCKKSIFPSSQTKIIGSWVLSEVILHKRINNSTKITRLDPNVSQCFFETGFKIDTFRLGDVWNFNDTNISINNTIYDYNYIITTNNFTIITDNGVRPYSVSKVTSNQLLLQSSPQYNELKSIYFELIFSK